MATSLTTAQIGAAGVLLIQYRLLMFGIDSAPMTTDAGIDLVAYSPKRRSAVTIQVKTCLQPKKAGGKGNLALDWWLPNDSPAEMIGVVNLESDQVWLFTRDEFRNKAQQRPEGRLHLYFYVKDDYSARESCHERDFGEFVLKERVCSLFGEPDVSSSLTPPAAPHPL